MRPITALTALALAFTTAAAQPLSPPADTTPQPQATPSTSAANTQAIKSVVKIHSLVRNPDFIRPWSRQPAAEATGTGWVIDGQRILTNEHVVRYASRVEVQPNGSTVRLRAEVEHVIPEVDLAVLRLTRERDIEGFFNDHPPIPLREQLPQSGDTVTVAGYPIGGDQLSVTEGVVSRIDFTSLIAFQRHLVIQTDAAVNPGNSGGPALLNGEAIGIVFARNDVAENAGYIVPTEEITAALQDIEDGEYDGRPFIAAGYWDLQNESLQDYLKVPYGVSGVAVSDDDQENIGDLLPFDVVTKIGDYEIDATGTIAIRDGTRVNFEYAVRDYENEDGTVNLEILRDGEPMTVTVPTVRKITALWRLTQGDYPSYFIHGPLVFMPAYFGFANGGNAYSLSFRKSPLVTQLTDQTDEIVEELVVVLSPFLDHPIATGYPQPQLFTVRAINGTRIKSLTHLIEVITTIEDEWTIIDWADQGAPDLVFRTEELNEATEEVLETNGIRDRMSEDLRADD